MVSGWLTSPLVLRAGIAAGAALLVGGLVSIASFVVQTAPGAPVPDAIRADAIVTSFSAQPSGWNGYNFPASRLIYREQFSFRDSNGMEHDGSDEVSEIYLSRHPFNSSIVVYFYPEAPDKAVIDLPSRLVTKPKGAPLGVAEIVFGCFLVFQSYWELRKRGYAF